MGDGGLRWWFRIRCKHIVDAHYERVYGWEEFQVFRVKLCNRFRWHTGECT